MANIEKLWACIDAKLVIPAESMGAVKDLMLRCMTEVGYITSSGQPEKTPPSKKTVPIKKDNTTTTTTTTTTKKPKTTYHTFYAIKNEELRTVVKDGSERKHKIIDEWKSMSKEDQKKWGEQDDDDEKTPDISKDITKECEIEEIVPNSEDEIEEIVPRCKSEGARKMR
jgi:hypothetical protein